MTGSGLFDFAIAIIVMIAVGVMFFLGLDRIVKDETFKKIAKIAVGVVLVILFLFALKGVLFGGGAAALLNYAGLIPFAIGLIVLLFVVAVVEIAIEKFGGVVGSWIAVAQLLLAAIAVIALLVLADKTLMGGRGTASFNSYTTSQVR